MKDIDGAPELDPRSLLIGYLIARNDRSLDGIKDVLNKDAHFGKAKKDIEERIRKMKRIIKRGRTDSITINDFDCVPTDSITINYDDHFHTDNWIIGDEYY